MFLSFMSVAVGMGAFARLIPALGPSPHLQWDKAMTDPSQLHGKIKLKPTGT
jgi:hypothetical protein